MLRSIMRRVRGMDPAARLLAVIALCFALGGTAYAAKTITGKNIKNGSLTGKDVKDGSLGAADFSGSVVGPQGPQGPEGPAGTALAFAQVTSGGTLVANRSKNIASVNKVLIATYCIGVAGTPVNAVASPMTTGVALWVQSSDPADLCPGNPDFVVNATDFDGIPAPAEFSIQFN